MQHKLKDEAALVWSMLERGGYVYISGCVLSCNDVFIGRLTCF